MGLFTAINKNLYSDFLIIDQGKKLVLQTFLREYKTGWTINYREIFGMNRDPIETHFQIKERPFRDPWSFK